MQEHYVCLTFNVQRWKWLKNANGILDYIACYLNSCDYFELEYRFNCLILGHDGTLVCQRPATLRTWVWISARESLDQGRCDGYTNRPFWNFRFFSFCLVFFGLQAYRVANDAAIISQMIWMIRNDKKCLIMRVSSWVMINPFVL